MTNYFKRLKPRHWAWVHVLVAAGIWWPLLVIFSTPQFLYGNVDKFVLLLAMWISVLGGGIKIIGYTLAQQLGRAGVLGVSVELIGLILASVGPVLYIVSYAYLLIQNSNDVEFGSAFIFAYVICAIYLYRAIVIVPRFRLEAHDPNKE